MVEAEKKAIKGGREMGKDGRRGRRKEEERGDKCYKY